MPTPSQQSINHSNYVTLREYIDSRFDALEKAGNIASEAMEKRVNKIENQPYFTRPEHNIFQEKIDAEIHTLEIGKAQLDTKASQNQVTFTQILAIVALLSSLLDMATRMFLK